MRFFLRMIRSRFKSENLVIMQVLTASSFYPETYDLISALYTVQRYYASHFYSAFMSSMVEKSLNKSFQTSYTFFGALNIRPQMMFTLNLSPKVSTLTPLV